MLSVLLLSFMLSVLLLSFMLSELLLSFLLSVLLLKRPERPKERGKNLVISTDEWKLNLRRVPVD